MASSLPVPRLSKHQKNTQLTYELPHRIYTAKTYPIQSQNGSTVIIYGHEKGARIVWRGGRSFKIPREATATSKKINGSDDAVILLDSDDEGTSAPAFVDKPEFEEEEEFDTSRPYPEMIQDLDLYFGTDVLHLALLPTSLIRSEGISSRDLEGLKQKIVFVAACADNSVRLVILPLTPPSPTSKARADFRSNFTAANAGNGKWGETVVLLVGHQKPSDGVSMTAEVVGNTTDQTKGQAGSHVIVASHSREVTGRLLLYRISISSPKPSEAPFQTVLLSSPAKSIAFNPSSSKRSSHLLVADASNTCRIYDFKRLARTSLSDDPSSESLAPEQGTWLLSLYPGFQKSKSDSPRPPVGANSGFGRKTIVDAQWVSGGRAILVLLSDGQWAIWDIEGVGPNASNGVLGRQGVKGGSHTEFSLTGFIEGHNSRPAGPPQITGSKFVPMTPGTRKATEPFAKLSSGSIRGQISVIEVPSTSPSSPSEESIVFWLGDSFTAIPSLSKYWAANARKSANGENLFNGTPSGRMIKLENIDLQGERCSSVEQLVSPAGPPSEVLVLGEHRFTIFSTGNPPAPSQALTRMALIEKTSNGGELDVVGIDRALTRMETGGGFLSKSRIFK